MAEVERPTDAQRILLQLDEPTRTAARLALSRQVLDAAELIDAAANDIELGRSQADERYFGYAAALLQPAAKKPDAPLELLVLWADVLQHQHQFGAAEAVLTQVLSRNRQHPRAHLLRANILMASGRAQQARADCSALLGKSSILVSTACIAQVASLSGHLNDSYRLLADVVGRADNANKGRANAGADLHQRSELAWAQALLADMAERAGDNNNAKNWLEQALVLQPDNLPTRLQLADVLLQCGQAEALLQLLSNAPNTEAVLLRRALAARRLTQTRPQDQAAPHAQQYLALWREAAQQAQQLGVRLHLRDLARGQLELLDDGRAAFASAEENWRTQREPLDAVLLVAAAQRVGSSATLQAVRSWQRAAGLEDKTLSDLLASTSTP